MATLRLRSARDLKRLVGTAKRTGARSRTPAKSVRTAKPRKSAKPLIFGEKPVERRIISGGVVELILPIRLTNGNEGRKKHWGKTAAFRKLCEQWCRVWFPRQKPFEHAVRVVVTRILAKRERLCDESSLGRGNWKEIEDSLVAVGWFHKDDPTWIAKVDWAQDTSQRLDYPRISVRISPAAPVPEKGGEA